MKKICCIFNFASHYRENIYKKIESEFNCDFYFGDFCGVELKKIDYSVLNSFVKELKYISLFSHFNWIKGSVNLVFKNKYDTFLMVGEPYCLSTWFVLIFSKILKKKTYLWTHGWYGDESYIKGLIKKIFFKLSSGIFLYGEYAKQLMIKEGFKKDKLHVIANSLDYEKMVLQRNKAKSPIYINKFHNNNPTIFFIGRLGKNKKLELLIDAHKFAQEKSVNFNVVLIGDGEHKDYLLKKTKKLGTENNVWFYGACYDEILISELIYNADLCVSPGNVGLTVIHSLSFGTPVITHNNFPNQMPEFEAIEQGVTGDFFEENSIESLEQVITKWLSLNPSKTEELINRCYEIVDIKYNPNYQMSILSNVLINK